MSGSFNALALFAGVHGAASGLRDILGAHVEGTIDFMKEAVATGKANGFRAFQADVREVDFNRFGSIDVIVGGPPCQPFSQGGRNGGENDERDMIPEFQRAVATLLPQVFVLENVRGLASPRHKAYLERRVSEFEAMGYAVDWRVLDIADYGVPQSRKRLFIVGVRVDAAESRGFAVRWPRKRERITMAAALGWTPETVTERNLAAPAPAHDAVKARWVFERPATTVVGSFRPEVQAAPGYRSTGDGPRQNAPGSVVTTLEERLVLQGLPADWKVEGSKTKRDLQIGNSCPPIIIADIVGRNYTPEVTA